MLSINYNAISTDAIALPGWDQMNVQAAVLRLDKIHSTISGNKWFKLRYYLEEAVSLNKKLVITFGGPWSNHLLATAAACRLVNLKAIGIVRGEEPAILSPTLKQVLQAGMELIYISRSDYRMKTLPGELIDKDYYLIPEGGYGMHGAAGAATILDRVPKNNYSHICCAVGTGTMMAGLIEGANDMQQVTGISSQKNNYSLEENIQLLLGDGNRKPGTAFRIIHDYHFGGYGHHQPALLDFMNYFYQHTGIPSDFVYTAKLFYGINDLVLQGYFPKGSKLLLIHSGGLQGNASINNGTLIF